MGRLVPGEFSVVETHGILLRPQNHTHLTSKGLGWSSIYASAQREKPYEDVYNAVNDHLIILHLDGPVAVTRSGTLITGRSGSSLAMLKRAVRVPRAVGCAMAATLIESPGAAVPGSSSCAEKGAPGSDRPDT